MQRSETSSLVKSEIASVKTKLEKHEGDGKGRVWGLEAGGDGKEEDSVEGIEGRS